MLSAIKKALHSLCRRRFNARHKALDLDAYLIMTPFSALGWLRHLEATPALLSFTSLHNDNCVFQACQLKILAAVAAMDTMYGKTQEGLASDERISQVIDIPV